MKLNTKTPSVFTAQGGVAKRLTPEQQLRRTVATCMLWESNAYEDGQTVADRIKALVPLCSPAFVAACAFEARTKQKLRHVPLLIVREMARHADHKKLVGKLLPDVIQRADEIAEFLAIYWKDGKTPLSKQVKKGLAAAFLKFNEYQFGKWKKDDAAIKLRDAMFLVHPKPTTPEQTALFKKIADQELATPDTWEVALSSGADKKETFERLMMEGQLGGLAFLRNLRNMKQAGVSKELVAGYASAVKTERILPFRYIAAARVVPEWEDILEPMMLQACEGKKKLEGKTIVLLDVSGSMRSTISAKSDLRRIDAAAGLAILIRELCEDCVVMVFNDNCKTVAPRKGFALRDEIIRHVSGGTHFGRAVRQIHAEGTYDRLIVLTDEQSADTVPDPLGLAYVINVANNKNGVGYGKWMHIDGWSEAGIDYIQDYEAEAV